MLVGKQVKQVTSVSEKNYEMLIIDNFNYSTKVTHNDDVDDDDDDDADDVSRLTCPMVIDFDCVGEFDCRQPGP